MKKSILKLGKNLDKREQKNISGGRFYFTEDSNPACIIAISFDGNACLCKYWIPDGTGKCKLDEGQIGAEQ